MDARIRAIRRFYARKGKVHKPVCTTFRILVDTREQRPYLFSNSAQATLSTGDYTVEGYARKIALERKGMDDLFHCLTIAKVRFKEQLKRLSFYLHKAVIIDSTPDTIMGGHGFCRLSGYDALTRIRRYTSDVDVPLIFAGGNGPIVAARWLTEAWKQLNGQG